MEPGPAIGDATIATSTVQLQQALYAARSARMRMLDSPASIPDHRSHGDGCRSPEVSNRRPKAGNKTTGL
ncbi:MAG: hypothetical protein AVDCRST_MAG71-934 [uncultured Lysobacter sp.]|uniref:Uncharacterized protein n=1 Tax=uncultured Lysobacter sp. TaxID=271060 RepID=A0A6J4KVH5_9GAMM|nr:MAG: hypothetical protein AVDCRST_MAG71-934 [uncultured Lysobacter sp.]